MNNIFLCGDGHGAISLVNGYLKSNIDTFIVNIVTTDNNLVILGSEKNIRIYNEIPFGILRKKDMVITSGYKAIIQNEYLSKAQFLNIHYALLPKYRGMHPIVWAILNGESKVGFTIHETTEIVDGGPIYFQKSINIAKNNSWELMLKIDKLVEENISLFLKGFIKKKYKPIVQNENKAICCAPRNIDDCRVNWAEWRCEDFHKYLKALVPPYPRPFFIFKDKRFELIDCHTRKIEYLEINGHVVHVVKDNIGIKIKNGIVYFNEFIFNDKKVKAFDVLSKIGIRLK